MKDIIVMGCDGYIGHALTLRLLEQGYRVIGIDDFQRRDHVEGLGSFSAVEIDESYKRHDIFNKIGDFKFYELSIDEVACLHFLEKYSPIAIVNLAQQPSGPFSHKSQQHAEFTTTNNLIGTLNVLYYMREKAPKSQLIQIGSMGEYDHSAGTTIPEGLFDLEMEGRSAHNAIFPRRPGSFYHASKVASTYYMEAACRWWDLSVTDIMQGVVYGNWTPEIEKYNCPTRLDSDECFGTVVNRFIIQAIINEPMTIYGKGLQKRGYLSVHDSVECLMLAIKHPPQIGEYRTWNQLDKTLSVVEIAGEVARIFMDKFGIDAVMEYIDPPRIEKTDDFYYNVVTDKLKLLGFDPKRTIADEVEYIARKLWPHRKDLFPLSNVVKPKITWK